MENIALYIAKACALTIVFYGAYYLLLRKETFFRANRWFLLAGMATSVLLPLAVFTKIIWVQPPPVSPVTIMSVAQVAAAQGMVQPVPAPAPALFQFEWWMGLLTVYMVVSVVLFARLVIDFKRILSLFKGQNSTRLGSFKIIDSRVAKSPFSFFNYIVYNSASLDSGELQGIISHEKVHSSQRHSIDLLLAQLFCIVFWFNPFAWLYKKAIAQNLEFIADAEAVKHVNDVTAYQKTLLKMTLELHGSSLASHFYQPLIKKRIIMINKPKSKKRNMAKYTVVLPLLAVFVGLFQIKTEAREKATAFVSNPNVEDTLIQSNKFTLTPYTKEEHIKENMALIAKTYSINASCDTGRNDAGEIISVKVELTGNGLDKVYEENNKTLINNLTIEVSRDANGKLTAGFSNPVEIKAGNGIIPLRANNNTVTVNSANITELDNMLVVIDGVKKGKATEWEKIEPNNIVAINVYKNEAEAVAKFGPGAEKGVIEITTRKNAPAQNTTIFTTTYIEPGTSGDNAGVSSGYLKLKNGGNPNYKKAYISLNGKEISVSDFENINPDDVSTILTIPEGNESTVNSFGPRAANGVIMVTAKKIVRWEAQGGVKYSDNDGKSEISLIENSGFIINKNTTEDQLKSYITILAKSGIKMTYGSIKRNSSGEMVKIKVELSRNGNKASATYESSTGIPIFYAGEKDSDVAIYTTK